MQLWISCLQKDKAELEKGTNAEWAGAAAQVRGKGRAEEIQPCCEPELAAHGL